MQNEEKIWNLKCSSSDEAVKKPDKTKWIFFRAVYNAIESIYRQLRAYKVH